MPSLRELVGSSIGAKLLMALTGFLLLVFLIGHVAGNLQLFAGQAAINDYGVLLRKYGPLLWVVRMTLIVAYLAHVGASLWLSYAAMRARPVPYTRKQALVSSFASRHMLLSGLFVFAFVGYHLLHFTFQATNPAYRGLVDAAGRPDIYSMMVLELGRPLIAGAYIASMGLLALHLWHSIGSMFQTTGVADARHTRVLRAGSLTLAALLVLGFLAVPVGVLLGLAPMPEVLR